MTGLVLDRMAIEEVGLNPQRLAEAIHRRLGHIDGPVPVADIAAALDIDEIRIEPLKSIEGALVTTPERGFGKILLNVNSSPQRRRFTLGHELLHFLNPTHVETSADGFLCSRSDMAVFKGANTGHLRQEAEANTFAIELLAPRSKLSAFLRGAPDLEKVIECARRLDISREAAARRYVDLHAAELAVLFCKDGKLIYFDCSREFPKLAVRPGQKCDLPPGEEGHPTRMNEADSDDWIETANHQIFEQTIWQANGHSITLLKAIAISDDDNDLDNTFDRFER